MLQQMEHAWREGQAGVMAESLRRGEPCPVCGSLEHPHPARRPPDVPDMETLKAEQERVEAAERERERAREAHAVREREVSRLESEVQSLEENLGEAAGETLKSVLHAVKRLERELDTAQAADRAVAEATNRLERMRDEQAELKKDLAVREASLKQADKAVDSAKAVVLERQSKLPKDIRTRVELDRALAKAGAEQKALVDAFEAARKQEAEAREALAEAKAALSALEKALKAARREAAKAERRFTGRIKAAGFADTEDYENAKMTDKQIGRLATEVDSHTAAVKAARLRLTRARQATRRRKRPDLAALESKAEDAGSKCDEAIGLTAGLRKEVDRLGTLLKQVKRSEGKMRRLEKRYYVTGKIADVANGKNALGITFQRFVLASLLDDVLGAASERLKVMSRGRFDLQRAGERADRRLAGGLDLEVYDSYTGTARPVSTLSGGETFLAALSLALGLADIVQAYTGGIRMETVFVDEGFGSLDPESLDLAVRALMDLQRGNRLVGIISHVPELKERIDVRLEVKAGSGGETGSTTRFVGF